MDTTPPTEQEVRQALALNNGSVTRAAEVLGVSRQTLYRLMDKYGIDIHRIVA